MTEKTFEKQFPSYKSGTINNDCIFCKNEPKCVQRDWVEENCIEKQKVIDASNKLYKNLNLAMPYASVKDKITFQANVQKAFNDFVKKIQFLS